MGDIADLRNIILSVQEKMQKVVTNDKIDELINMIKAKDDKISDLENRVKELEKTNGLLERKLDDGESYTRRQNLRA